MKKSLKIILIIIFIVAILAAIYVPKIIDANTKFALDFDSKFILDDKGNQTIPLGGLGTSNNYLEIDLKNKKIDYRYDFEYFDLNIISDSEKAEGTKKRELINSYKLDNNIVKELEVYFEKIASTKHKSSFSNTNEEPLYYYLLQTKNGDIIIHDEEEIKELKQILSKVDEIFNLY